MSVDTGGSSLFNGGGGAGGGGTLLIIGGISPVESTGGIGWGIGTSCLGSSPSCDIWMGTSLTLLTLYCHHFLVAS